MATTSSRSYVGLAMDSERVVAMSAAMRREIAECLSSLPDTQLAVRSLCAGWDVLTVGAHLAVSVTMPTPALMAAVIRHGGSMRRANDRLTRQMSRRGATAVIDALRRNADRPLASPRNGPVAPMTEVLVHAGDIYRPLGLDQVVSPEFVREALDFVTTARPSNLVPRRRLVGLRIVAEDVGFAAGSGEELRGNGLDLIMVLCGRISVLPALGGSGVSVIESRLGAASGAG
jgi:uncharacterized protein (TIGR03083 family)